MRTTIFAAAAFAALMGTVPASADVFFSNDPAAGDGSEAAAVPAYGGYRTREFAPRHDFGYACQEARERYMTARGRVVIKTHRSCY